jgi:hypothetical protein
MATQRVLHRRAMRRQIRSPLHRRRSAQLILESTKSHLRVEKALRAAILALRSYQYGNAARGLARSIADAGDDALRSAGKLPATLGALR